jgi:hypothetical protein
MKKMPLFLGVAFAALTLASCEKELEQVNTASPQISAASTLAKPELLAASAWHQTGLTVSSSTEGSETAAVSDLFAHSKAGMLVANAVYKADGTYSQQRGAREGSPAPAPTTGTWQLSAAADSLTLTQADHKQRLAVAELTATTLRLTYSQAADNGKVSTYTSVYSH